MIIIVLTLVTLLFNGFQYSLKGFSAQVGSVGKEYAMGNLEIELNKDFHKRFLFWFDKRSKLEQLIKLLKEGDMELQREIQERANKEGAKKNIFQKLFSSNPLLSDLPTDGVQPNAPIKYAFLGGLVLLASRHRAGKAIC